MNSNVENAGLEKLKEAFREINQWEYENLHLDTLEEVIPSARYKKRIERLIKRQKQPYWRYVNTVGKRVAILVVAIALTFALPMGVSAVREPVVEFFMNVYERFVEFFYDKDDIARAPDIIETVYTLEYVPEGYEMEECIITDLGIRIIWMNDTGDQIVFLQSVLDGWSQMDYDDSNYEMFYMKDIVVAFLEKGNIQYYYWNTQNYRFVLHLPSDIPYDIVNLIIESVTTNQ